MSASRRTKKLESAHQSKVLSHWLFGLCIGCVGIGIYGLLIWENVNPALVGRGRLSGASVGFPAISPYLFWAGILLFFAALLVVWRSNRLESDLWDEEINDEM